MKPARPGRNTISTSWAIVLAGGSGRRLESLTRSLYGEAIPKQFCSFGGGRSLLQETLDRVRPTFGVNRTLVVVNSAYRILAEGNLDAAGGAVLVEQPQDRGTAAGILLPLMHVFERDPEAMVTILPSDHGISDSALFNRGLWCARTAVERSPSLVVLGAVQPGTPECDYGWIVPEQADSRQNELVLRKIARFVEKPAPEAACRLLTSGALWSTFVVVARARTLLDLFHCHLKGVAGFFENYLAKPQGLRGSWLTQNYGSISVADFSSELLVVAEGLWALVWPERLGWTDLGTPSRLIRWSEDRRVSGQSTAVVPGAA